MIEIQNPCIFPQDFYLPEPSVGPIPYNYYSVSVPGAQGSLENIKADPDVTKPNYMIIEPTFCETQMTFRCITDGGCNIDDGST